LKRQRLQSIIAVRREMQNWQAEFPHFFSRNFQQQLVVAKRFSSQRKALRQQPFLAIAGC
jgi:hypothetical protein